MLRIVNTGTEKEQRWTLYGQLTGPWVAELKANWENTHVDSHGRSCVVDLTDVTFIDECGEYVLRAMQNEGAKFVARGVETKQLLADLTSKRKPSLRKCLEHLGHKPHF